MESNNFKEKLDQFIKSSQNVNDNKIIKSEYLKLVKEFHPNVNKNIENEIANEYMINIWIMEIKKKPDMK
jgi:DnaJ-class molecular chaperone